ncbi:hypothetical protein Nepgr_023724 [Nepenthes gracilis]|uniref:C3HC-type domain-containing protein n=1 Tax=Nepenthes gracilis TaxID=150966 RepID=A0AAD3T3C6_NEPGR|nr:hypothetical protein Nepgr_023724 [Nepenthes gracilis]
MDAEQRFHTIMNNILNDTKSNRSSRSSLSIVHDARGLKRPYSLLERNSGGNKGEGIQNMPAQAPPCRPWDRGDLMRRLATFKSMTWFAKPKVADAVNCARKGWINVDMDIIACEVCGAHLLFSTPSSWSLEQVEKAALVFSLKLDNGHKMLCPWINNACDAILALFPPTAAPELVCRYKECCSALLQLSALPIISASAIENMRSPLLEYFLEQSITVECGNAPGGSTWTEYLGNKGEVVSADSYYQAHRLLSLCGWEPRYLPYIVDCNDQSKQSINDVGLPTSSNLPAGEWSTTITVYHLGSDKTVEADDDPMFSGIHFEPSSTVLECKLCGARVGLWTFTTVPRPLELVRVVGYTDINSRNILASEHSGTENHANVGATGSKEATLSKGTSPDLSLTIAGGPPPTKQNFRAKISFPIIGRSLRARLSLESMERRNVGEEGCNSYSSIIGSSTKSSENLENSGSHDGGRLPHTVEDAGNFSHAGEHGAQVSSTSGPGPDHNDGITNGRVGDTCNHQKIPRNSLVPTENMLDAPGGNQNVNGVEDTELTPLSKDALLSGRSKGLKMPFLEKTMEFHPIRLHRHFCPWVVSTDTTPPGWKQTLLALQKEKVFSLPESKDSLLSPSLVEVDDPIASIRNLFKSPAKRMKSTKGSS